MLFLGMRRPKTDAERLAYNAYARAWEAKQWKKDPKAAWIKFTVARAKKRARADGRECEFQLNPGDLPDVCPVLGIPLIYAQHHKKGPRKNSPSIDRFDNTRGYVQDNIRVISNRANTLKNSATVNDLLKIIAYINGKAP